MALLLREEDVQQCLNTIEAIEAVANGFRFLSSGEVTMPQRTVIPVEDYDGTLLCMPAYVRGTRPVLSAKLVTVHPDNPCRYGLPGVQGAVFLIDPATGQILALLDAEYVTALRTGAAGGLAARLLANPHASVATVFGAGVQARQQIIALAAVRPIRKAWVICREDPRAASLCKELAEVLGFEVIATNDAAMAVRESDVVVTATTATEPVLFAEWLRPGTHVTAIGAFTRTTREVDSETVRRAKLYVDHRAAALVEAGDILIPLGEGAIAPDHIVGEIGEVLLGRSPGRMRAEEITLFKSVGLAVQDAMVAQAIYEQALTKGLGQTISLP